MDVILKAADTYLLNDLYQQYTPASLRAYASPDHIARQSLSLFTITMIGVHILYFTLSSLSYYMWYDHELEKNPKFLPNQIWREIKTSLISFPITTIITIPWFLAEIHGYSKLYNDVDEYGWGYLFLSLALFLAFTDMCIYWIHRWEHHPALYWWLHKPHHAWKIPTPYAAFAFHPLDGYFQSLPYHIFVFLFPMNVYMYLIAFVIVQVWTVTIHDGVYLTSHPAINGSAHHMVHHLEFNYNYGQYSTLWDRIGGSHKEPVEEFEKMYFPSMRPKKVLAKSD